MRFSSIRAFTLVILAGSALALPARTEDTGSLALPANTTEGTGSLTNVEAPAVLEKRVSVIAILLIRVIGGKLFAGAMSAGIERAKEALAPSVESWKDFDEARTNFMQQNIRKLYENREPGSKGVICINGPYTIHPGARYDGPATEKYKWDIYYTTYDCFDIFSGSITNDGDGGWINWGAIGCPVNGHTITC